MQLTIHLLGAELLTISLTREEGQEISVSDLSSILMQTHDEEDEATEEEEPEDGRRRVGFAQA